MSKPPADDATPLASRTSAAWAEAALADPLALLDDHAHLERKAASNALALLSRGPGADAAPRDDVALAGDWTRALARVAKDEAEHLVLVLRLLHRRGGTLRPAHRNPYAAGLRALVREGEGRDELVDRLLVSALIEARSCERFERLAAAAPDDELGRLYRGLESSERGHFRIFLDLARRVGGEAGRVEARWAELVALEAKVLAAQPPGPRMHAGEPRPAPDGVAPSPPPV